MRAGARTLRVTIQTLPVEESQDPFGAPEESWSAIEETPVEWVSIAADVGNEGFTADRERFEQPMMLGMRFRTDITTKHRLLAVDGRVFDILAAYDADGRRRELTIRAVQRG